MNPFANEHPRNAELVDKFNGTVMFFRELPVNSQLALIHYMSVDGAAWAVKDDWEDWRWGEGKACDPELRQQSLDDCLKFLPRFVKAYGSQRFGSVDVPLEVLKETISKDEYFVGGFESTDRHWEYDKPTWPVILSSYDNETLQDGWNRFYRYCALKVPAVTCLYYLT